jgi:hypothetical protein
VSSIRQASWHGVGIKASADEDESAGSLSPTLLNFADVWLPSPDRRATVDGAESVTNLNLDGANRQQAIADAAVMVDNLLNSPDKVRLAF